jgi:hypothetical protein
MMASERRFTILYGPGETLRDAIAAAGIFPAPGDEIVALWSKCDDLPAECRLVSVERDDGISFFHYEPSATIH